MSKKVLIITSNNETTTSWLEREQYVQKFCKSLEAKLENIEVSYTTYENLSFFVRLGKTKIFDKASQKDLKEFSLVHFKNWTHETELAALIADYLDRHGVVYFNSEVKIPLALGKISQMFTLAHAGIPVPDTFYSHRRQLIEMFTEAVLPDGFQYPLIMKSDNGAKGDDNHLLRTPDAALEILSAQDASDKNFVLQNYLPNDGDYRLLFIGLNEPPLVFHRRAQEGSHLNNTSKGGSGNFVKVDSLPQEFLDYAKKAATVLKREIGGVDILVDKTTGKAYILEVNTTPAIATGYGLDEKLDKFAGFLEQALDIKEKRL